MIAQDIITIATQGRGTRDITAPVDDIVRRSGIATGLCHVFVQHTSAAVMLCENADPTVRGDLERFMSAVAPDGAPMFHHDAEGPDDMPAHVRTLLTGAGLAVPVRSGRCALGTWQGLYLWEHRHEGSHRTVVITVMGDRGP